MSRILTLLLSVFLTVGVVFAAEEPTSPKEAFNRLKEGNARFAADKSTCPERHQERRIATASKQRPFAVILGCSDSRIPPEFAFDQGIGDLFVVRIAGNVVSDLEIDSVDYSALTNDSKLIVVLGHESCGAIQAVLKNTTKDIPAVAKLIKPAVKSNQTIEEAVKANIRNSVDRINKSPVIAKMKKEGKIAVVGAYYHFTTGEVTFLDEI